MSDGSATKAQKARWPYPERCTLTAHPAGQWCKKIRGKVHYFGRLDDPKGAMERYFAVAEQLHAGAAAPDIAVSSDLTVDYAVNAFLNAKLLDMQNGEIQPRTYSDYKRCAALTLRVLGKSTPLNRLRSEHFTALKSRLSPSATRRGNEIIWIRSMLASAARSYGVALNFGEFKRPGKKTYRLQKLKRGKMMYSPTEIRTLLDHAGPTMKALMLLGINAGFGNKDLSDLPRTAVDLDAAFIDTFRHKTAVVRQAPLWPETVKALREYQRPQPAKPEYANRLFLTRFGLPLVTDNQHMDEGGNPDYTTRREGIYMEFRKLSRKVNVDYIGKGFYAFRHTFETIGMQTQYSVAVRRIMGHVMEGMEEFYVEQVDRSVLEKVTQHVHDWLFNPPAAASQPATVPGTGAEPIPLA